METTNLLGIRYVVGEEVTPLAHDNDNWELMPDWQTPAEFLQWIRWEQAQMRRELAADPALWSCPTFRRHWSVFVAMTRCALWHCYGVR